MDGGAELVALCTNTMHKVADAVSAAIDVPLVHIADATATAVRGAGFSTVGLLATDLVAALDTSLKPDDRRLVHDVICSVSASSTSPHASSTCASSAT